MNTVVAGTSLLAKIKSQAEKESQKQKQMDNMMAKLKGRVIADKQALTGNTFQHDRAKSGKYNEGSTINKLQGALLVGQNPV